ncbi:MAG: transketolase [candidate division KSB1 bacterium]|nr:transketolase [candidate division KSB1 bacterium]MDZ7366599.1 transketolase [candidate division KSB1 bacterium]MDZ7406683.1 transketolase [candidate division KSB1 bacterium]
MQRLDIAALQEIARELRLDIIRMLTEAGSGHPGGSLSAIDMITCLYFSHLRHRPEEPNWPDRDRFILSKGHGVPAVYAVLAKCGYFPKEKLMTLRKLESPLQGHPDRVRLPGIEASTGSLGQGLSIALGMALASKIDGNRFHVYCMIGDGEAQAGQIWEALMAAPHLHVDTLTVMLDYNKGQIDGPTNQIMNLEPIVDKLRAFNWHVEEIDGHNYPQILSALDRCRGIRNKPTFIVAHTIKGRGVSFMEHVIDWHGKAPTPAECEKALADIRAMKY